MPKARQQTGTVSSKDIIKALNKLGWREVNQVGSHKQFKHPTTKEKVTLPHPKKDLAKGTLSSILKQMGITHDELTVILKK